jgi:hypothetical protein
MALWVSLLCAVSACSRFILTPDVDGFVPPPAVVCVVDVCPNTATVGKEVDKDVTKKKSE